MVIESKRYKETAGENVNRKTEEAAKRLKQLMTADLHKNNIEIRFDYLNKDTRKGKRRMEMDWKAMSEKEGAAAVLSQILQDVLNGEYIPIPKSLPIAEEDEPYFRNMTVLGLRIAIDELIKDLNLEDSLRSSLMRFPLGSE